MKLNDLDSFSVGHGDLRLWRWEGEQQGSGKFESVYMFDTCCLLLLTVVTPLHVIYSCVSLPLTSWPIPMMAVIFFFFFSFLFLFFSIDSLGSWLWTECLVLFG